MAESYNPEFNPTGIEGGVDTNLLPWLDLPQAPSLSLKPLRASAETGAFSTIIRIKANTSISNLILLGAMDMMVLSGSLVFPEGPLAATVTPGTWGYVPANTRLENLQATTDTEFLANFYGPICFADVDGVGVASVVTALDILHAAEKNDLQLVPNTLSECMKPRINRSTHPAEPLAISQITANALATSVAEAQTQPKTLSPHFVDTAALPWIINPGLPDIALKILRVSEESGTTSLIVRHNGVAGPHYHLGAADFLVLSGQIGYRAGPPEGYGPGVWFFEPAGARHEATQRLGDDDLIYTANVYGPVQFDDGPGTPIAAVQSWMQYRELADEASAPLVKNTFDGDTSLLAWAPLGGAAQR